MSYAYFNIAPPVQRYLNVQFSGLGITDMWSGGTELEDEDCPAGSTKSSSSPCTCKKIYIPSVYPQQERIEMFKRGCTLGYTGSYQYIECPQDAKFPCKNDVWFGGGDYTTSMTDITEDTSSAGDEPIPPSPTTPSFFPDFTGGSSSQSVTPGSVATSPAALPFWGMAAGAVLVGLGIGIMFGGDK